MRGSERELASYEKRSILTCIRKYPVCRLRLKATCKTEKSPSRRLDVKLRYIMLMRSNWFRVMPGTKETASSWFFHSYTSCWLVYPSKVFITHNYELKIYKDSGKYSQLPITRGQDCLSMGKFFSSMGQVALIVNLQEKHLTGNKIKQIEGEEPTSWNREFRRFGPVEGACSAPLSCVCASACHCRNKCPVARFCPAS